MAFGTGGRSTSSPCVAGAPTRSCPIPRCIIADRPDIRKAGTPARGATSHGRARSRTVLPGPGGVPAGEFNGLLIQRATAGSSPEAPPAAAVEAPTTPQAAVGAAHLAAAANEIHLLANEVWHLLKRRLAVEAERRGG